MAAIIDIDIPHSPAAIYQPQAGISAFVGNTPLIRLSHIEQAYNLPTGVELYAKAEYFNPGGSVKDRAALWMIRDGERRGLLSPGKTILDASSGNTGIAYAMLGAALGYRVDICLPTSASPERKRLLSLYGASIIDTPAADGTDGAILQARRLHAASPGKYFYPDQYNNRANWQAHYDSTAPEIWRQTNGLITHFVAVLGTSGTFMGTSRRLKEYNPGIDVVEVQPDAPFHGLEGMKHMPTAIVPGIYDETLADRRLTVNTEEAQSMTRALAAHEGILAGPSGGAAVLASTLIASTLAAGIIVTILPDGGSRYLQETFWQEQG